MNTEKEIYSELRELYELLRKWPFGSSEYQFIEQQIESLEKMTPLISVNIYDMGRLLEMYSHIARAVCELDRYRGHEEYVSFWMLDAHGIDFRKDPAHKVIGMLSYCDCTINIQAKSHEMRRVIIRTILQHRYLLRGDDFVHLNTKSMDYPERCIYPFKHFQ